MRFDVEFDMNITDNYTNKEYDLHNDDVFEFLELINKQNEECVKLKKENWRLIHSQEEVGYYKAKSVSCEERLFQQDREISKLKKENEQLKKESYGNLDGLNYYQEQNGHLSSRISDLECENEQLKSKLESAEKVLQNIGYELVYSETYGRWLIE